MLLSGCTTGRFTPATLPASFQAPVVQNSQSVDLSRLAMSVPPNDVIDVGDVIEVTVAASLNSTETVVIPVRINERGNASLPVIGDLQLAGLDMIGAESAIAGAAVQRGLYRSPQVTVMMKQRRLNRVTVVGAVKTPGVYELPRRSSDLLAAITAAGQLAPDAGADVEIRYPGAEGSSKSPLVADAGDGVERAGHSVAGDEGIAMTEARRPNAVTVNLVSATTEGTAKNLYVPDGAVVHVEKRTPTPVHVMGLVGKPGQYDFPLTRPLRVLDAIAMAGGTSTPVADKVFVIRKTAKQEEPVVVQISLKKAKQNGDWNLRLGEGDTVSVEETPSTVVIHALQLIRPGIGMSLGGFF